jgi:uncharacterized protein with von Willebrand factor type A (vWA) domain
VIRPERKNNVRLLMMMDVGGSMEEFRAYYFHNCIYENVYADARLLRSSAVPTGDLFRMLDERWKVAFVGDAAMHPHELVSPYGNIDPRRETETPGIVWLQRIADHFDRCVWLNPDPEKSWPHTRTTKVIGSVIPMFHLSVDGLEKAVAALVGARKVA